MHSILVIGIIAVLGVPPASSRYAINEASGGVRRRSILQATHEQQSKEFEVAVFRGNRTGVERLVASGVDVDGFIARGYTPLYVAASLGDELMVQKLLSLGAKPNLKSQNGASPLHKAAALGDIQVTRNLLEQGANVNLAGSISLTALHYAAYGDIGLKYTRNDLAFSIGGHSPQREVSGDKFIAPEDSFLGQFKNRKVPQHQNVVAVLLSAGADVDAVTDYGETPMHYVAVFDRFWIAELLVNAGADIEIADVQKETPLHEATAYGAGGVVQVLLVNGADTYATEQHNLDPRQFICRCRKYHRTRSLNQCAPSKCLSTYDRLIIESMIDKARGS